MLMSMFSSFDAFCAESFGQKVGLSWASGKEGKEKTFFVSDRKEASSSIEGMKKVKEGIQSKPPSDGEKSSNQWQQRRPRFAPELDGVNCFETIVLY